jgi:NifU-like protein involved in Fe-S cluster formation
LRRRLAPGGAHRKRPHCRGAVASASLLTELIIGKSIEEIRGITAEQISQALGGLPAATRHGSQLAEDALDEILEQL